MNTVLQKQQVAPQSLCGMALSHTEYSESQQDIFIHWSVMQQMIICT